MKYILKILLDLSNKLLNAIRFKNPPPSKIITVKEYARIHHYPFQIIDKGYIIQRTYPNTIDSEPHWKFRIEVEKPTPEVYVSKMKNIYITRYGTVFSGDGYLLGDVSKEIGVPIEHHSILTQGNLPDNEHITGSIAVIESNSHGNYFHFLLDTLPRLSLIEEKADYYYISNEKKFMKEYLNFLGIAPEKIIPPKKNVVLTADEVIIPSCIGNTGNPTYRAVNFIRTNILDNQVTSKPNSPKRIYISRKDARARKLLNEPAIEELLQNYGFSVVSLDGMDVSKQIELFSNADVIVSVHGAGFSNIIYSRPKTKIIEFFSPLYVNVCYWSLANICNLKYAYLIGEGKMPQEGMDPHRGNANLIISPVKLKKLLLMLDIPMKIN